MTNSITTFNNSQFGKVRTVEIDSELRFIAVDVCRALNLGNTSQSVSRLDDDEKGIISNDTGDLIVITESGLYSLVIASRKKEAKEFKRWITHEVIPSIRKHGAYMTPEKIEDILLNPDTIIQLATALKEEREKRVELAAKITRDQPLVQFANCVAACEDSIPVDILAKILHQNGINIGRNSLYQWFRDNGYLQKSGKSYNRPTQYSADLGLFRTLEWVVAKPYGEQITVGVRVTGKGQTYFVKKFLEMDKPSRHSIKSSKKKMVQMSIAQGTKS